MKGYCPCKGWYKCGEYALRIIYEGGNEMERNRILGIQQNAKRLYDLAYEANSRDGISDEDLDELLSVADEMIALDIPEMLEEIQRLQKEVDEWEAHEEDLIGIAFEREIASDD